MNGTLSKNAQIERKVKWKLDYVSSSQLSDLDRTVYIQRRKQE